MLDGHRQGNGNQARDPRTGFPDIYQPGVGAERHSGAVDRDLYGITLRGDGVAAAVDGREADPHHAGFRLPGMLCRAGLLEIERERGTLPFDDVGRQRRGKGGDRRVQ